MDDEIVPLSTHQRRGHSPPLAPGLPIPSRAISVVEHPCIIKNVDKGIASLGGPNKLSKGLRSKLEPETGAEDDDELPSLITASLRPDDPFAKRLLSTPVTTHGLLLKVTLPKRTGRKRLRGSSDPFLPAAEAESAKHGASQSTPASAKSPYVDATTIFRSLQDNTSSYKVTPVGVIDEVHRFRNLPDLQCASTHNRVMIGIRDYLLPGRLSQLKRYALSTAAGADLTQHIAPSADFLQMPVVYDYRFQQNPFVKYTDDKREVNLGKTLAYSGYMIVKPDTPSIPTGPKETLPPETGLTPYLQSIIANVRAELERRPIITRHMLYNKLGWDQRNQTRQVLMYCGYFFESGPWRETLIKWGLDPRKKPEYRNYQTISYTSYSKVRPEKYSRAFNDHIRELGRMSKKELEKEHTFDGVNASLTGNLYQFCDISDPVIRRILDTKDIRSTCAPTFQGWYHIGTWAKASVILKDKLNRIVRGETPDDSLYERVLAWPEIWNDKEMYATYREEVINRQVHKEKAKEHELMYNVRLAARNPRYAFEKLEELDRGGEERVNQDAAEEGEEPEELEVPEDMTEVPETAQAILHEGEDVLDGEDDEDDEDDDFGEYDDDEEDAQNDDENHVSWQPGDALDETASPPRYIRGASEKPLPFGGLYRV